MKIVIYNRCTIQHNLHWYRNDLLGAYSDLPFARVGARDLFIVKGSLFQTV